ncbi:MAG: siderophore biosynthesis protein [Methylobacter sp.]|nr:MAG: siderophore biosynthesis protein [Methylobacter sp.]
MKTLILLTHTLSDAVNSGFLPAAKRLGLQVVLLTDHPDAHRNYFQDGDLTDHPSEIISCDVFNPLAVIETISRLVEIPAAIFSNSDHLQTSTAVAAQYFGLPGKNWMVAYLCKNKAQMRLRQGLLGMDSLTYQTVNDATQLSAWKMPFPCVVKPKEGVASQHVRLAVNFAALQRQCNAIWEARPGCTLLVEEYLEGPLYTLETLGDGTQFSVLGGFRVTLSPPPNFVELYAQWEHEPPMAHEVVRQIKAMGVGFGACHTEYVVTPNGPRLIEINYRCIGDHREFLLEQALKIPFFEIILRLHLGEPLNPLQVSTNAAEIRYLTAASSGTVTAIPAAFTRAEQQTTVSFRQLRQVGDQIVISHSNKDYIGVVSGFGRDRLALKQAIEHVAAGLRWEIQV